MLSSPNLLFSVLIDHNISRLAYFHCLDRVLPSLLLSIPVFCKTSILKEAFCCGVISQSTDGCALPHKIVRGTAGVSPKFLCPNFLSLKVKGLPIISSSSGHIISFFSRLVFTAALLPGAAGQNLAYSASAWDRTDAFSTFEVDPWCRCTEEVQKFQVQHF